MRSVSSEWKAMFLILVVWVVDGGDAGPGRLDCDGAEVGCRRTGVEGDVVLVIVEVLLCFVFFAWWFCVLPWFMQCGPF